MNILAIIGSPRKGQATDTLVDKAIEGVKAKHPKSNVKKVNLVDSELRITDLPNLPEGTVAAGVDVIIRIRNETAVN